MRSFPCSRQCSCLWNEDHPASRTCSGRLQAQCRLTTTHGLGLNAESSILLLAFELLPGSKSYYQPGLLLGQLNPPPIWYSTEKAPGLKFSSGLCPLLRRTSFYLLPSTRNPQLPTLCPIFQSPSTNPLFRGRQPFSSACPSPKSEREQERHTCCSFQLPTLQHPEISKVNRV